MYQLQIERSLEPLPYPEGLHLAWFGDTLLAYLIPTANGRSFLLHCALNFPHIGAVLPSIPACEEYLRRYVLLEHP